MPEATLEPLEFIDLRAQYCLIEKRVTQAVSRVLQHGKYILGPEVAELEEQLADLAGVGYCVSCSSGTDALKLALLAWDIKSGDAVFVPSFTFAASAEAVASVGATPVFVDVEPTTFNIAPDSLAAAIASVDGLRAQAVIAVDLFGQPADYEAIEPLCREHDLRLLADAAQSFGASMKGRSVGALGEAASTSFFPAKPLGCYGDGGAVFTNDRDLASTLRSLRVHGQGSDKYDNVRIGINGRLDTIQAAVLLEKLAIFPGELETRQAVADRYSAGLDDIVECPSVRPGATSVWAQYTIKTPRRDELAQQLRTADIPTAVYYPLPLHQQIAYRGFPCSPSGLPVSEDLARAVLSLPMHPYLTAEQQGRVIEQVRRFRV